jgi:hypothetical protein
VAAVNLLPLGGALALTLALTLTLLIVAAAAQALAWGLARLLALRLPASVQALGICLPLAVLLPLPLGNRLLAPTDAPILANLPDAPRVTRPDEAHGVFNDAVLQLLPWEAEVRRGFAEGHLPLWSDVLDGGSSPWVNPQAAVLSPIAMLGRLVPIEHFLLATLAVKILLAFEGCWLLARALGGRRLGSAFGGAAFALGGPVMAWAVFPLSSVVAWSPWLALGAVRVVRAPAPRAVAAAALILAALLLSGHPEIALAECVIAAGFGLVVARRRRRTRRGGALLPLGAAALAAVLGASLAAGSLLPFLWVAPRSLRAARVEAAAATATAPTALTAPAVTTAPAAPPVAATATAAPAPAAPAAPAAVPPEPPAFAWFPPGHQRLLLSPLSPWSFGRPFHEPFTGPANWPIAAGGYLGLAALAGVAAALAGRRRRLAWPLGALALGIFLLAAGFLPWRWLLGALPLGRAAAADRCLPAAALPLAVLAALGLDSLLRRPAWPARLLGLLAAAASLAVRHDPPLAALWLLIALAVLLAPRRRAAGAVLLALAALCDLATWDWDVLPRGHRELFYPRTPLVAAIASGVAEGGPWRAVAGGFGIYPSLLPMYGVAEVRIDNPMALEQQLRPLAEVFDFRPEGRRYKSAFNHLDHPFLDFLNVRVVVLPAGAAVPPKLEPIAAATSLRGLRVFRNPAALPRWFLPVSAEVRDRRDVVASLRGLRDPRRVVLAREEVGGWLPAARQWQPDAVRLLQARRGALTLALPEVGAGEKLLATSLPFPAGWQARSAGRPAGRPLHCLTVNGAYLGVRVPAGVSRVDLSFAPPGFRLGMVLSALAAIAIGGLVAVRNGRP